MDQMLATLFALATPSSEYGILTRCLDDPLGDQMRRRKFIADTAALLVSLRRSRAQGEPRRVGYLGSFEYAPSLDGNSLCEKGSVEGKNPLVGYRYAKSPDRLPALAAELIVRASDQLIASCPKLVQSLPRPAGNVTGLAINASREFIAKRIEISTEIVLTLATNQRSHVMNSRLCRGLLAVVAVAATPSAFANVIADWDEKGIAAITPMAS